MSSSSSPCAACRFLRQKCTRQCVFAPYFPVDQPEKFVSVHQVFGRGNVAKLLKELNVTQREDAVRSLVYEANARLEDPVYGCVGPISLLQQRLRQLHHELDTARKELATYIGPQAMAPILHSPPFMTQQQMGNPSSSSVMAHDMMPTPMIMTGIPVGQVHGGQLAMHELHQHHAHQRQQIFAAQQLTAVMPAREQQQLEPLRLNGGRRFEGSGTIGGSGFGGSGTVTATGFQHIGAAAMASPLALGTFDIENPSQVQPQAEHHRHQFGEQIFLQPQQTEARPHPQSQQQLPQTQQQQQFGSKEPY